MRRNRAKLVKVSAVLVASAVLATACGGNSDSGTAAGGGSESTAEGLPERVAESGVLRVGSDATIGLPWVSLSEDQQEIVGLDADIARAIAEELGVEAEVTNIGFDSLIASLQADRVEMTISTMLDTEARRESVDFIDYYLTGSGMMVRPDEPSPPETLADLCGERVGALRGSAEALSAEAQSQDCEQAGEPPLDIQVFPSFRDESTALDSERIDVALGEPAQWQYLEAQQPDKFMSTGEVFNAGLVGIAVPKGDPFAEVVREALQEIIDNGTYAEILEEYGVGDGAVEEATINAGTL